MTNEKPSMELISRKKEARNICKTILEFGVTDDQNCFTNISCLFFSTN